MKTQIALVVIAGCTAGVVSAQSPSSSFPRGSSMQSWQNPGIKNVLAQCKNPPKPFGIPINQSAATNAAPPDPVLPSTTAIPGVLAAGLDAGLTLEVALRRASVAAALACLALGAQEAMPGRIAIDEAAAQLG